MTRTVAICVCATVLSACGTVAPEQKAASRHKSSQISRLDEIRDEIGSLAGNYDFAGLARSMGMPGWLSLHPEGTFVFYPGTCTGTLSAIYGAWHPEGDRIELEGDDDIPKPQRMITKWFRISYVSLSEAGPYVPAWLKKGIKVVRKNGDVFLYPLDPALQRDIRTGGSQWPMRRTGKARGFEPKQPR